VRREECLNLTWDCVDLEAQQVYLPKSKTGSRFVVLNETALGILNRRTQIREIPYVFCRRWITKELDEWRPICSVNKAFQKITKRCAMTNFRIHDLRHSFASMAINNGASLFEIKSLLGHADVKTSARYSHISPARLREASGQVAAAILHSQV
jgi:integrase